MSSGSFGNLHWFKHENAPADDDEYGHKHAKHHITIVASGRVRVSWKRDNGETGTDEYAAPACFNQEKDVRHKIEPLEPSTWYCVFSLTDKEIG